MERTINPGGWIKAKERMPKAMAWVLGYARCHADDPFKVREVMWKGDRWVNCVGIAVEVTHWMPLPQAPMGD